MRFQGRLSAECPFLLSSDCKLIIRDKLQLIECFVTSRSPQGKKLSKLCLLAQASFQLQKFFSKLSLRCKISAAE